LKGVQPMKASEWIDRVKSECGWESDYRVAKELGLSKATVSAYRTRTPTLDDDTAVKVAAALGTEPELIILDQVAERTKNDEARAAIGRVLQRLGGIAATVLMTVALAGMAPRDALATGGVGVCQAPHGIWRCAPSNGESTTQSATKKKARLAAGQCTPSTRHLIADRKRK
jgi:transcriptional regulator with XRE-family HTH domain